MANLSSSFPVSVVANLGDQQRIGSSWAPHVRPSVASKNYVLEMLKITELFHKHLRILFVIVSKKSCFFARDNVVLFHYYNLGANK